MWIRQYVLLPFSPNVIFTSDLSEALFERCAFFASILALNCHTFTCLSSAYLWLNTIRRRTLKVYDPKSDL